MSKSILVIDTPENCGKCPCFLEVADNTVFMPDIIEYTRNYAIEFVNKGGHCGYRCRNKSIHFAISGNTVYNHKIVVIGNVFDNL